MRLIRLSGFSVMAFCAVLGAAPTPVSVTGGAGCEPPALDKSAFVVEAPLQSVSIPVTGWKVVWPVAPAADNAVSGIALVETNALVRGVLLPALRLELTKGTFANNAQPVIQLDVPFNAEIYNLLSFYARTEVPPGLKPLIGDSPEPQTGFDAGWFNKRFDDFGIAVDDGNMQWAAYGVPTTHFRHHDFPATRGPDGFADVVWDMKNNDHTCNKGFVRNRAKALRFLYDTRKIPAGQKVVVTIALPKFTSGAHAAFDAADRYAAWLKFVAGYKPDYSDSSKYLEPPATGRIARPIPLARGGKALAEIVVDLSDAIRIDNFFPKSAWNLELRAARGYEVPVARHAAFDLQYWLGQITGGDFPVLLAPSAEKNVKIFLGATFAKPFFGDDLKKLAAGGSTDGYAVRVRDGNIYIFGARPAGTRFGVHRFIENNTDLIWAFPKDPAGTVFTRNPDLKVVWADVLDKPVFIQRGWGGDAAWKVRNGTNFGGDGDEGLFHNHGGHFLSPQYYDSAEGIQQFNPVHDGKRVATWSEYSCLCCLRDPEFIKHSSEVVPDNVGELRYRLLHSCVFGTDDNSGVCECPVCTAPIKTTDGRMLTPDQDYMAFYGAWFYDYLNRLDDMIQKSYPGFVTSTYAYFFAAKYPPIRVNKTIVPWLCTYVRKAQNLPIFAPVNQHWWKTYQDWARHTSGLMLYDYYGLLFYMKPVAEVHQFDLRAQRDIGFLRTSTEGDGSTDYIGVADEGWCMARLQWNPDADVEQLHRYFDRRTYREAAPWIDKFRGTIRENFYKNYPCDIDFEEHFELVDMIHHLGLEQELRGYLAEALKAVRNPSSKILVERMIADFDAYLAKKDSLPSSQYKFAAVGPVAPTNFWPDVRGLTAFAATGDVDVVLARLETALADRRAPDDKRVDALKSVLVALAASPRFDAARAADLMVKWGTDDVSKALGWSDLGGRYVRWQQSGLVRDVATAFARRGDFAGAAAIYDRWIHWDRDEFPIGIKVEREKARIDFFRGQLKDAREDADRRSAQAAQCPKSEQLAAAAAAAQKRVEAIAAIEKPLAAAWCKDLARAAGKAATAIERGNAIDALTQETWDSMGHAQKIEAVDRIVNDKFMSDTLRQRNTLRIPAIYMEPGATNWTVMADHVVRALSAGDWSSLRRNSYFHDANKDLRLDALCAVAEQMIAAGQNAVAKDLLQRGSLVLGYSAGFKAADNVEPGARAVDLQKRLDKLEAVMKKVGAVRLPARK